MTLFNPENKIKLLINSFILAYNLFYLFITSMKIFYKADFGHYGHYFKEAAEVAWVTEMLI